MAVYTVHSECVKYRYKTTICSKATVFNVFVFLLTVTLPLVIAYITHGFWLKNVTYLEQPDVHFKHEFVLVVETERPESPVLCSSYPKFAELSDSSGFCSMVTSREIDSNHDDKNDRMIFEVEVLMQNATAKSVKLFLLFDYKLHGKVQLRMESLASVQHVSSSPGTRLDIVGDLRLVQKQALSPGRDSRFNVPVFDPGSPLADRFSLRSVLGEYASRSVSSNLKNVYSEWLVGRGNDQTFTISMEIQYLEETVLYRPGIWETMKWAWVQYVTIAVVVGSTLKMLKGYMLRNNIIPVMKDSGRNNFNIWR